MRKNKASSGVAGMIILVCILAIIGSIYFSVVQNYNLDRDTTAWMNRAQVASNPDDMYGYLVKCREGMDKWGMTTGHDTIWFPTSDNNMELVMQALDRSIERCEDISNMAKDSPEYQTALDDVRGQIRELDLHSPGRWWMANLHIAILLMLIYVFAALFLAIAILHELLERGYKL